MFKSFVVFLLVVATMLIVAGISSASDLATIAVAEPWYTYLSAATFVASALANFLNPSTFLGKIVGFIALNFRLTRKS